MPEDKLEIDARLFVFVVQQMKIRSKLRTLLTRYYIKTKSHIRHAIK